MAMQHPDYPWPRNSLRPTREEERRVQEFVNAFYANQNADRGRAANREVIYDAMLRLDPQIAVDRLQAAEGNLARLQARGQRIDNAVNNPILRGMTMPRRLLMQRRIRRAEREVAQIRENFPVPIGEERAHVISGRVTGSFDPTPVSAADGWVEARAVDDVPEGATMAQIGGEEVEREPGVATTAFTQEELAEATAYPDLAANIAELRARLGQTSLNLPAVPTHEPLNLPAAGTHEPEEEQIPLRI